MWQHLGVPHVMLTSTWGRSVLTSAWSMLTSALTKSTLTATVSGVHWSMAPHVSLTPEPDAWDPSVSRVKRKRKKEKRKGVLGSR